MANDILKLFLLSSITFGWVGVLLPPLIWGADKHKSVSWHSAATRNSYFLSAALETLSAISLFVFLFYWMIPTYNLPLIPTASSLVATTGLFLVAVLPAGNNFIGKLHDTAATTTFSLSIIVNVYFAFFSSIEATPKLINAVVVVGLVFILVRLLHTSNRDNSYHLYWECLFFVLFDTGLLAITFID